MVTFASVSVRISPAISHLKALAIWTGHEAGNRAGFP